MSNLKWTTTRTRALVVEEHHGRRVKAYGERPRTIGDLLDASVRSFGAREAIKTPQETLSYDQLRDMSLRLAAGLRERGVRHGDRIAVLLPNDARICLIQLAAAYLGAVVACMNTRFPTTELLVLLERSDPTLLVIDQRYQEQLANENVIYSFETIMSEQPHSSDPPFAALMATQQLSVSDSAVSEDDSWLMLFTSGTTGVPKGALLTHSNVLHSSITYADAFGLNETSSALIVMPLYYATAIIAQVINLLLVGGRSVICPVFKADAVVDIMREEGIEYFIGVPTMYQLMLMQPDFLRATLPRWRVAAYGGSPMPSNVLDEIIERFPNLELYDAYGLTETSSPITIMTSQGFEAHAGSVGRAVPGAELKVVDDHGQQLPSDMPGELLVRGPMVVPGYWRDPEATDRAIRHGWLHTGDLARMDRDGYVYILDRKKDMIMRGGFKIYSVKLEYLLLGHPGVQEAAVVGVPDPLFYEEVLAGIVRAPTEGGAALTEATVRSFVAARAADYEVPKHVYFVDQLPRNPTGKVRKRELRDRWLQHHVGGQLTVEDP